MSELVITPWKCPFCVGGLVSIEGGRCIHCHGTGLTDDPCGPAERAPRPPGVMRTGCADCAFRPGSPELEANGANLPDDSPFYCHQGVPQNATGKYVPTATCGGKPVGLMVCAGWWAMRTGEPLPREPFREVPVSEAEAAKRWGPPAALSGGPLTAEQRRVLAAVHQVGDPS